MKTNLFGTIKLLLSDYQENIHNFRNPKIKKASLWVKLSKKMKDHGYNLTPDACDKKFRNLKITYKTIKDKIKQTGRGRQP